MLFSGESRIHSKRDLYERGHVAVCSHKQVIHVAVCRHKQVIYVAVCSHKQVIHVAVCSHKQVIHVASVVINSRYM